MIDTYRSLAVFETVARTGGFSAAARELRLSTSVVSHHISKLEKRLGVSLFYRSTRSLSLTPEGAKIKGAVARMVAAGAEAIDLLSDTGEQPIGALRIAIPAFGGANDVQSKVWDFARLHPMVSVTTSSSDKPVDLIKGGFDLAIRLGRLADSSLKSRRVDTFQRVLAGSPDYLARRGPIKNLTDLRACDFVSFAMLPDEIDLTNGEETVVFTPENIRIEVDTVAAARSAMLMGLGLQRLPLSSVKDDLAQGNLVEVLPDWKPPTLGVFAVWPGAGPEKKLTRMLIDFLSAS